jgi:hypothetical protein
MMNIQQQTMSKTTSQADMMNSQQQTMSQMNSFFFDHIKKTTKKNNKTPDIYNCSAICVTAICVTLLLIIV